MARKSRFLRPKSNLTIIPIRFIRAQSVLTIVTAPVQVSTVESTNSLTTILCVGRSEKYLPRMEVPTDGSSTKDGLLVGHLPSVWRIQGRIGWTKKSAKVLAEHILPLEFRFRSRR